MIKHNFEVTIKSHVGVLHYMELQNICSNTLHDYGFAYTLAAHDNSIYIVVNDNGDIDADTLGACMTELSEKLDTYISKNCPIDNPES